MNIRYYLLFTLSSLGTQQLPAAAVGTHKDDAQKKSAVQDMKVTVIGDHKISLHANGTEFASAFFTPCRKQVELGFVGCDKHKCAYIEQVMVPQEFRGHRYGYQFMLHLKQVLSERGYTHMHWLADPYDRLPDPSHENITGTKLTYYRDNPKQRSEMLEKLVKFYTSIGGTPATAVKSCYSRLSAVPFSLVLSKQGPAQPAPIATPAPQHQPQSGPAVAASPLIDAQKKSAAQNVQIKATHNTMSLHVDGKQVASAMFTPCTKEARFGLSGCEKHNCAYVSHLMVASPLRNQGYGMKLGNTLIKLLTNKGYTHIHGVADPYDFNLANGQFEHYKNNPTHREALMAKLIKFYTSLGGIPAKDASGRFLLAPSIYNGLPALPFSLVLGQPQPAQPAPIAAPAPQSPPERLLPARRVPAHQPTTPLLSWRTVQFVVAGAAIARTAWTYRNYIKKLFAQGHSLCR